MNDPKKGALFRGVPGGTHVPARGDQKQDPTIPGVRDYERVLLPIPIPARIPEKLVYRTKRRWRAIDCFLTVPNNVQVGPQGAIATIAIYAVTQGVRVLVASGRINQFQTAQANTGSLWICGARVEADNFEVTFTSSFLPAAGPGTGNLLAQAQLTVCASDEAVNIPDTVGCQHLQTANADPQADALGHIITLAAEGHLDFAPNNTIAHPQGELVAVNAVNTTAAVRYLMAFEPTFALTDPVFVWALPPGGTVRERGEAKSMFGLPQSRSFRLCLFRVVTLAVAPWTASAAGDVLFQAWLR